MVVAAKTLALTAYDIFKNPEIAKEAHSELLERRGKDFQYESLVGDRKPPLDYRDL
jgi:aminobenzoyl-glutamate utilization protein B